MTKETISWKTDDRKCTWGAEVRALLDKEIAENQILTAKIEFLDNLHEVAILRVWRRAPSQDSYGDGIEELRSLVSKDGEGKLQCWVIQGSRSSEKGEKG